MKPQKTLVTKKPRILNGEKKVFYKWSWENWIFISKKVKLDTILHTKINSKWKHLKPQNSYMKTYDKNSVSGLGNGFWIRHSKHKQQSKNKQMGLHVNKTASIQQKKQSTK